jgi:hypothetical protein
MPSPIISDGGLIGILDSLDDISERHFRYSASLILRLTYGHRVDSTEDKYVQLSETAVTGTNEVGNGGSQVVDLFPPGESPIFFLPRARSTLKLKAPPPQCNTYQRGFLGWVSNDTLSGFAKMFKE